MHSCTDRISASISIATRWKSSIVVLVMYVRLSIIWKSDLTDKTNSLT